jgi:hypothetical protein
MAKKLSMFDTEKLRCECVEEGFFSFGGKSRSASSGAKDEERFKRENKRTNEQTNKRTNEQTNKRTNEGTKVR